MSAQEFVRKLLKPCNLYTVKNIAEIKNEEMYLNIDNTLV